jgi:hypothetical protein
VASAVAVTLVTAGRELVRRHDIVLFEVQRGELGTLQLTLPAGLEPEAVVTDEGAAPPWFEGRTLRVERARKLTGAGYVAVLSQPASREAISLEPVLPETKLRAHYLAYASGIAAEFAPEPAASWSRADVSDLPEAVQQVASALGIVAAWRLRQTETPGRLAVTPLPSPKQVDAVVTQRDTTTLLTVESTLLHRDRFTVEGERASLEISLPANGMVWSAQVGDVPVRPVEQAGRVLVPLGLAAAGPRTVEIVVVQERAIAAGRSTLDLELPQVGLPVLGHDWRLLLPERNRYRYAAGSLRPVATSGVAGGVAGGIPGGVVGGIAGGVVGGMVGGLPDAPPASRGDRPAVALGTGGTAELRGNVLDATGGVLPGAEVRLTEESTGRALTVVSDANGNYRFGGLAPGAYTLHAELAGFKTAQRRSIRLSSGQSRALTLTLDVGAITEEVQVASEQSYRLSSKDEREKNEQAQQVQQAADFRDELDALKQGLVGGVKPLPVRIPEAGKLLRLAGALPPSRVSVSLEVKAPKD